MWTSREGWRRMRCGGSVVASSLTKGAARVVPRRIMRRMCGITLISAGFGHSGVLSLFDHKEYSEALETNVCKGRLDYMMDII